MRIVSRDRLVEYGRKHPSTQSALDAWAKTVESAKSQGLADLRKTYPKTDGVDVASGRKVFVFNVRGNNYRLLAAIDFAIGVVNILQFLTHAEYDKDKWKSTL